MRTSDVSFRSIAPQSARSRRDFQDRNWPKAGYAVAELLWAIAEGDAGVA
jgi:hypothetical protein